MVSYNCALDIRHCLSGPRRVGRTAWPVDANRSSAMVDAQLNDLSAAASVAAPAVSCADSAISPTAGFQEAF